MTGLFDIFGMLVPALFLYKQTRQLVSIFFLETLKFLNEHGVSQLMKNDSLEH